MREQYVTSRRLTYLRSLHFSAVIQEHLRRCGVLTAEQLVEVTLRFPNHFDRALGLPPNIKLEDLLPNDSLRRRPRHSHSFTIPPLGIPGPVSGSPVLMRHRADSQHHRKHLAVRLREIERHGLPTHFFLHEFMPAPIGDQGSLGSCVGWGSTAQREFLAREGLSPLYAYALAKHLDGRPDVAGSWQYFAFVGLTRHGTVREEDFPYTDHPSTLDPEPLFDDAAEFKADAFSDVLLEQQDMELQPILLKALLSGRLNEDLGPQPVSVSLAVHEQWDSPTTSLYGLVRLPLPDEKLLGGHAVALVGYLDASDPESPFDADLFIFRNSWGTAWATENPLGAAFAGHGLIPTLYFERRDLLWEALICLAEPSPAATRRKRGWVRANWEPVLVGW